MGAGPRRCGGRSVLETLVVRTVNDGCPTGEPWSLLMQNTPPGKEPQGRGPNEIGGSLFKRWSMWFNSIVRAKPYRFLQDNKALCVGYKGYIIMKISSINVVYL